MIQMNWFTKQKLIHRLKTYDSQRQKVCVGGVNWKYGINI